MRRLTLAGLLALAACSGASPPPEPLFMFSGSGGAPGTTAGQGGVGGRPGTTAASTGGAGGHGGAGGDPADAGDGGCTPKTCDQVLQCGPGTDLGCGVVVNCWVGTHGCDALTCSLPLDGGPGHCQCPAGSGVGSPCVAPMTVAYCGNPPDRVPPGCARIDGGVDYCCPPDEVAF